MQQELPMNTILDTVYCRLTQPTISMTLDAKTFPKCYVYSVHVPVHTQLHRLYNTMLKSTCTVYIHYQSIHT